MRVILLLAWVLACGTEPAAPPEPTYTNRLIDESSPYLLQHAHNPVDWHPWSEEAFARAKAEDKPIFLSVGYSTCHWCHVMEEESFEDEAIAALINEHYVAIKVDREERPDIDAVYMRAVQALAGRGGWPMTLVLRPDGTPIFAATYLPPRAGVREASEGLEEILGRMAERWKSDRSSLEAHAEDVSRRMQQLAAPPDPAGAPGVEALDATRARFAAIHDPRTGGFGRAPRFPRPTELSWLFREYRRTGDEAARDMALDTLDAIARGGLRDHLAGGFHRYTVDGDWRVPHFEKMLYDQAQLALVSVEAWQITGEDRYRELARETLDFALREMHERGGGFHSALDADSLDPEGALEEGRFYTWTPAELAAVLTPEDAALASAWYEVDDSGELEGRNVLQARRTAAELAGELGRPVDEVQEDLLRVRKALYQARRERPSPRKDDKVILGWNALMVSALARASFAFDEPIYAAAARSTARFIGKRMTGPKGELRRSWRAGESHHDAVLEDYALFAHATLDLFEATGEGDWFALTRIAVEQMDARFAAPDGGWYATAHDAEALLVRDMPWADTALPSANGAALGAHLRLYALTGDEAHREKADAALSRFGTKLEKLGPASPSMLGWLGFRLGEPREVVIAPGEGREEILAVLRATWSPDKVQVLIPPGLEFSLGAIPVSRGKFAQDDKATAYVCTRGVCEAPTTDPAVLREQLSRRPDVR